MGKIFELSSLKSISATLLMVFIIFVVAVIAFLLIKAYRGRKELMAIKLPELSEGSKYVSKGPEFEQPEHITVELIDTEEEEGLLQTSDNKDKGIFSQALSTEAGVVIVDDVPVANMPEVEEMDYDKNSEALKLQREKEKAERLKSLALADSEEEIISNI